MEYLYKAMLSDSERRAELEADIDQGHHKSATLRSKALLDKLLRDVKYGFVIQIHSPTLKLIPGLVV